MPRQGVGRHPRRGQGVGGEERQDAGLSPPLASGGSFRSLLLLPMYMVAIYTNAMDLLERLRGCTGFDWDSGNSGKNWEGHQVSDGESEQVFFNHPLLALPDEVHSRDEDRILVLGRTDLDRRLFVVCTIRKTLIRVISARDMSRKEREAYSKHG
jgi:uncharacterized protein